MRRLGVAPTVEQLGEQRTTDFLSTVYERLNVYTGTNNPTINDVPTNQWVLFKNTTTGELRLWGNDNGAMKSILLSTASSTVPAFSAYQSTAQALTAATFTKMRLQTEEFDNTSSFDNVTNFRYQPTVAGIYLFTGAVAIATTTTQVIATIYKNGAEFKRGNNTTSAGDSTVTALVQMNGTTDYVELWGYSGVAQNTSNAAFTTYFQGHFVSP